MGSVTNRHVGNGVTSWSFQLATAILSCDRKFRETSLRTSLEGRFLFSNNHQRRVVARSGLTRGFWRASTRRYSWKPPL